MLEKSHYSSIATYFVSSHRKWMALVLYASKGNPYNTSNEIFLSKIKPMWPWRSFTEIARLKALSLHIMKCMLVRWVHQIKVTTRKWDGKNLEIVSDSLLYKQKVIVTDYSAVLMVNESIYFSHIQRCFTLFVLDIKCILNPHSFKRNYWIPPWW